MSFRFDTYSLTTSFKALIRFFCTNSFWSWCLLIKQEIHVFTQGVGASFGCQVGQIFFCEDSADPRVGSKSWYTAPPPPLFASSSLTTPIVHWHYRRQRQLWQWQQWRDYQTSMNHRYPQFPIANLFSSLNFVLNMFFLGCYFGTNLGFVSLFGK